MDCSTFQRGNSWKKKKSFFVIKFNNERCRPVIKELESGETLASIELYGLASTKIEEEA